MIGYCKAFYTPRDLERMKSKIYHVNKLGSFPELSSWRLGFFSDLAYWGWAFSLSWVYGIRLLSKDKFMGGWAQIHCLKPLVFFAFEFF
jgi:hypothetical protein